MPCKCATARRLDLLEQRVAAIAAAVHALENMVKMISERLVAEVRQ